MKRTIIALAGALVALGFLFASAVANYMFGASLGRTPWEAHLYGAVGVLAVAMNALAPFYISWSLAASRRMTAAATGLLWALCLIYSTTSALGFAAQNREGTAIAQQVSHDAYEDTRRELFDLEARRKDARQKEKARLDAKIDDARKRLAAVRDKNLAPADAQSQFLSALTRGLIDARHVRVALVALFSVMVEMCATLGLFAALSHSQLPRAPMHSIAKPVPAINRWKPKTT
jgi:ABC-type multidrug transport system fused ATPase/permease subunit